MTLTRVTIQNNHASAAGTAAAEGGGIHGEGNGGAFTIKNATITGNTAVASGSGASDGGGIFLRAVNSLDVLNNVTIAGNNIVSGLPPQARGAGIFLGHPGSVGSFDSFTISNTIIGGNGGTTGPDCFTDPGKAILSDGHNLVESISGCTFTSGTGDLTGQAAQLDAVAANGGFTKTMALQSGSPAVNTGSEAAVGDAGACEAVDQRCYGRPAGGRCDIGAFEKDAVDVCAVTTTTTTTPGSTTTTTLNGCGVPAATFSSIECRLDALIARLNAATDLGKLKKGLVKSPVAARTSTQIAEDLADGGKNKPAKKKLKQATKRMSSFVHRLKSLTARKKLPAETRTSLIDEGTPIQADLKTLQQSL